MPVKRYVVKNENTLGVIHSEQPDWLDVIVGRILNGGDNWKDGPKHISELDIIRSATTKDFDYFNVQERKHNE
jgi:hypothetical protein